MPELDGSARPRIALVSGDAAAAARLREALVGQVDIAYASSAAEFDAAQAADAGVEAALVNLDGDESLDPLEAALAASGVRAVFNDPEISNGLEGWERARWLRHLVAKLRGSSDVDPPRPVAATQPSQTAALPEPNVAAPASRALDMAVAGLPLSPQEIDSLTADFVAGPVASDDTPAPESNAVDSLDIDTEALSAMIDARLAEPEQQPTAAFAATPADEPVAAAPVPEPPSAQTADGGGASAELPALGDWQLLDTDIPLPASKPKQERVEPTIPDGLGLADLELVPMELVSPVTRHTDPIERWLHDAKPKSKAGAKGGNA